MVFTSSMADPWTVKYQDACKLFDVDPSKTAYSGVFEEEQSRAFGQVPPRQDWPGK